MILRALALAMLPACASFEAPKAYVWHDGGFVCSGDVHWQQVEPQALRAVCSADACAYPKHCVVISRLSAEEAKRSLDLDGADSLYEHELRHLRGGLH